MTLLELLVQELPKRGGWPKNATDSDVFAGCLWGIPPWGCHPMAFKLSSHEIVTYEQYHGALAAVQKAEWDGTGLPPVGCEVEYLTGILGKPDADDNKPENGQIVKVVSHAKYENTGNEVVVATWLNGSGGMRASVFSPRCLQPIRSEAERKREEAIAALKQFKPQLVGNLAGYLYDEIAEGKIPGIRIE